MPFTKTNVINLFQKIIEISDRVTSGNISRKVPFIYHICGREVVKAKYQGFIIITSSLNHIINLSKDITCNNYIHRIKSIKNICIKQIEYIKEYGLS